MSVDPYATALKAIKTAVYDIVNGTASFNGKTSIDKITRNNDYLNALISLRSDSFEAIGPKETRHSTIFLIEIEYIADEKSASQDDMIDYVGEIVDAIESSSGRQLGTTYIERTEVQNVDYTRNASESIIIQYAGIPIMVESIRNM